MSKKKLSDAEIYDIIIRNMSKLRKAGVLFARPGLKMIDGKVVNKLAIVVTVLKKKDNLKPKNKLPLELEGVLLDVREARPMQILHNEDPDSYYIIQALGPREMQEPDSPWECSMKTGMVLPGPSDKVKKLTSPPAGKKKKVDYSAPTGKPLKKVSGKMTITAYASPDDGYTVLSEYLKGTKKKMTIGMYDFTSGDLLSDLAKTIGPKKMDFTMVLDHPARNATAIQIDPVTRQGLLAADPKARINWALDNMSPDVTGEIFPHAYHIKVVVRDQSSFWLSSGNFNVSNQPNFAGAKKTNDPKRGSFNTCDRDWHVIVENKQLANLYEAYLQNDFDVADDFQASSAQVAATEKQRAANRKERADKKKLEVAAKSRTELNGALNRMHEATKKSAAPDRAAFKDAPSTVGKKRVFKNVTVSLQPLLTPDKGIHTSMYLDNVISLIKSAKHSIFIQMQYITLPAKGEPNKDFALMLKTLGEAKANTINVQIIVSQFQQDASTESLQKLFGLGEVVQKQTGVHNKGIVVDGKTVLVSSQNWSTEGVTLNRDAGLIIENEEIAAFFEGVFKDDWKNRLINSRK